MIQRQRFLDASFGHHRKAYRISQGEILVAAPLDPIVHGLVLKVRNAYHNLVR